MAGRAAPTTIDPSGAQGCLAGHRGDRRQQNAPAASDRFAPMRSATRPGARQHPLPDAEIAGAEVSSCSLSEMLSIECPVQLGLMCVVRSARWPDYDRQATVFGIASGIEIFNAGSGA